MSETNWPAAEIIKQRRKERRLNQTEVAEAANLVLRVYQRYERGEREPSFSTVVAIAQFLDIPLSELAEGYDLLPPTVVLPTNASAAAIADAIQNRRRQIGLTHAHAAKAAGLSVEQYQRYESGADMAPLDVAIAIASALDMPLPELAGIVPRPVDLNGQWWASFQGALDQSETIDTFTVTVLQAGDRLLLDQNWRGELQLMGNEVLSGWYRPNGGPVRTRLGVFLWLPTHENYLYGQWTGVSTSNTVVSGWCVMARDEERSKNIAAQLVSENVQPRPALRLPGLSSWG